MHGLLTSIARLAVIFVFVAVTRPVSAQIGSNPKQEFRAAWIATVANLDWPAQGASAAEQQADLVRLLDRLKEDGFNAVVFQVRNEADALYASPYEPWSVFLTGTQGQDPGYDPLAFAVAEAHKRGMELHAWFNPYRVWVSGRNYPRHPSSVYLTKPEWLLTVNNAVTILNPGIPDVRNYVIQIIRDVVERYDVDGVHFDDYFYPYPPNTISTQDQATFNQYGTAFGSLPVFRAYSVNMLVKGVRDAIAAVRPEVKWGISPFGIWKSGTPAGITGMSGATEIYADAVVWMEQQWLDYLTPQLYWAFGGGQDYGKLAPWWATQMNGRHLVPGLAAYRQDVYGNSEIHNQIRLNRRTANTYGQVLFRARSITGNTDGIEDSLRTNLFRNRALTPTMPWKDVSAPGRPTDFAGLWTSEGAYTLSWTPVAADATTARSRFFAVYRVRSAAAPDWNAVMADPANLLAVTGETRFTDRPPISAEPYRYVVTAVSPNSVESLPTGEIVLSATSTEAEEVPLAVRLLDVWPNPFTGQVSLRVELDRRIPVDVRIHDLVGRVVAVLSDGVALDAGLHELRWEAGSAPAGAYFVVVRAGDRVLARPVVRVR